MGHCLTTLPWDPQLSALCACVSIAEGTARIDAVRTWIAAVDPPGSPLHRRALATTLLDACRRLHGALHEQRRVAHCNRCAPDWSLIAQFADEAADPRRVLERWASTFLTAFDLLHPPSAADRAAAMMRDSPSHPWRLALLGRAVGLSTPALRRTFQERFGMTPVAYLHLLRARRSVTLCGGRLKVEAIAFEVGYRSKKDLYAALSRWVGLTPMAVRRLTSERRKAIEDRLDSMVAAGRPGTASATDQRRRRVRTISTASSPPTSAAPPISATPA